MYSDFMKKKVVNIWGTNFSSVALKKPKKATSPAIEAGENISKASSAIDSKNDILKKKVSDKKSNF